MYAVRNPDDPTPTLVDVLWYLIGDAGEDLDESAEPSSSYTLSADPAVWDGPGEYLLGTRCDNDEMTDRGGPTVVLYALRPKAITFGGGNHIIYPDNPMDPEPYNEPYEEDHWYDHNGDGVTDDDLIANPADHDGYTIDRRLPVAYTRDTAMTIEEFVPLVDAGEEPVGTPYPGPGAFFYRATYDDPGGGDPTVFEGAFPGTPAVADTALPDHIAYLPSMQLRWEVSFDGEHLWFPIGTTNHEVYVTLDTPTGQRLESMYHIAVLEAQGESKPTVARDAIWARFASRLVQRKDGAILGYYRNIACSTHLNGSVTAGSLLTIGNGQCNAWVELFQGVLGIHGIASQRVAIAPRFTGGDALCTTRVDAGFLVKDYSFAASGTAPCENYPYKFDYPCPSIIVSGQQVPTTHWGTPEATDAFGVPGQDEPDPASAFGRHFIVRVPPDLWYDPSYGAGPWVHEDEDDAALAWENDSVAGFFSIVGSVNINGVPHLLFGVRPNDLDTREVVFTVPEQD